MERKEFMEIISEFVQENFEITGCRACYESGNSEITEVDHKGSYSIAINELYNRILNNRIPVVSSNLEFLSYSEPKQELTVWFKNRKAEEHYIYSGVPVTVFGELMAAKSKGSYFSSKVRNLFQVEKKE